MNLLENTQLGIKMEKKFRKGDRVRYIGDDDLYLEKEIIAKGGSTYEVVDAYNCGTPMVLIKYEDTLPLDEEDVELVSRPSEDKKTAFLTELKELLERYDAYVTDGKDISGKNLIHFGFCNEDITYAADENGLLVITPSNIFDYDKGES